MKCFFLIILVFCLPASPLLARVINVPGEYTTIQAGIDVSANGDTVLVGPGEYHEYFIIDNRNILLTSSNGPNTTNIYGFCILRFGIDSTCVIRGLCFIGTENQYSAPLITCYRGITPKIEGNILRNNLGPGIESHGGNPIIRGNIIRDNWVRGNGGGISLGFPDYPSDNSEISRNIICHNRAGFTVHGDGRGGGIYIIGNARIFNNLIYDNAASEPIAGGDGGGIWRGQLLGDTGHATIIFNNTICNNIAKLNADHGRGGGLFFSSNGDQDSLIVVNNIIAFNYWGGNVKGQPFDSMYFYWDYNLIYEDTTIGFPHGEHDICLDPKFVDTMSENYRLLANSPCIDAGDPSSPLDPDSTRADIGAYFFDQSVGIDDPGAPTGPYEFTLGQNYPNPFNAQTIISYCLDNEATVSLHIYAITGHLVRPLLNKEIQNAGEHNYIWDGRNAKGEMVSTGIYFYELYVDDSRESKAMIMVK
jgi:parallel beta-helix repeat protein